MSGEAFIPLPSKISNRGFLAKLMDWGWKVKKVSGEWTTIVAPSGYKIDVRSGHTHTGNSKDTITEVLDYMDMTWEVFMMPFNEGEREYVRILSLMEPNEFKTYREEREEEKKAEQEQAEQAKAAERARQEEAREARRVARRHEKEEKKEAMQASRTSAMPKVTKVIAPRAAEVMPEAAVIPTVIPDILKPGTKRVINTVFDALVDSGEPMSVKKIHELIEGSRYETVRQAAANLAKQGVIDKVKPGVYKIREEWKSQDVRIDVVARAGERQDSRQDWPGWVTPVANNQPKAPIMGAPMVNTIEAETINEVLDLMFPQGFKARHLPLIDAWRQATIDLLRTITTED